jgi:hypothetical protein
MLSTGFSILTVVLGAFGQIGSVLLMVAMICLAMIWTLVTASGNYLAWREVFAHGNADPSPPQAGIIV